MASPGWLTGIYEKVAMESSAHARDSSTSSATPQPKPPSRKLLSGRGHRQITRNRASYSCHTCRRRKVKCDKVHPVCGNCAKNETECVYDAHPPKPTDGDPSHRNKRRRDTSQTPTDTISDSGYAPGWRSGLRKDQDVRSDPQAIEARLDKLTSMIERLSKASNDTFSAEEAARQLGMLNQAADSRNTTLQKSSDPPSRSSTSTPRRNVEANGEEFPIPPGNATDVVDPVGSLNLGHLSLEDGGKSRYVGSIYWAYISDEINELNQLLRDQARSSERELRNTASAEASPADRQPGSPSRSSFFGNRRPPGQDPGPDPDPSSRADHFYRAVLFPSGESPTTHDMSIDPDVLENVPSKRQSDVLYRGFMSGIHAISPVVHPPTVLRSYRRFWDWYSRGSYSGEPYPEPSFIPLLYAIWYGGSVTISLRTIKSEFGFDSRSALGEKYNQQVTRWLTKISFPRSPTLHGLTAFLLVQTILSREEEPLTSSLFISLALRVAQTMGLHRDPAQFGIHPSEAEARRRVWWHIVHMDCVVAMSSGLPPLVNDEAYWDVRETSEIKDTLLGTPQAEQYTRMVEANLRPPDNPDDPTVCGGSSMVNVFYLWARGKYITARAIRRILRIQLGTKRITGRDMEELNSILIDLQFKLKSLVNRIPLPQESGTFDRESSVRSASSDFSPRSQSSNNYQLGEGHLPLDGPDGCAEQYHSPVLVAFHKWARILLSLFIDKAFCVAYQPFLKNVKSKIWPAARQGALRHCHGFMEKFIALATDPEFQPFQWSWPGNHQPMHATMILLIDLYERPNSPQALRSRAYVDKIFSMVGPDGGVVGGEDGEGVTTHRPLKDGGREAWEMMRRLREKAWQKAGLDPQQFWTDEQAQLEAGVASDEKLQRYQAFCAGRPGHQPSDHSKPDPHLLDFSNRFYTMTKSQTLPSPVISSLRQEPTARHAPPVSQSFPDTPPMELHPTTTQVSTSEASTLSVANNMPTTTGPSNGTLQARQQQQQQQQQPLQGSAFHHLTQPPPPSTTTTTTSYQVEPSASAMPPLPSLSPNIVTAPTPPSMVDPNLTFDWDEWDAVFGQQLPVADEVMDLDPVAGFGLPDLGLGIGLGSGAGGGSAGGGSISDPSTQQHGGHNAGQIGNNLGWNHFPG